MTDTKNSTKNPKNEERNKIIQQLYALPKLLKRARAALKSKNPR